MAKEGFIIEESNELDSSFILRDTRRTGQKIADWLKQPDNLANLYAYIGLFFFIFPIFIPIGMIPVFFLILWHKKTYRKLRLPMRMPAWTKAMDPSGADDKEGGKEGLVRAKGIAFLGNKRNIIKNGSSTIGEELWISDSDIRVHKLVMATTGGGKTNTLVSWLANDIMFGSGATYVDGKAQTDVFTKIWGVCWNLWREDDVLCVNYMVDNSDNFEEALRPSSGKYKKKMSNTMNPFAFAQADTINNILQSLMPKASGDGAIWQSKANNMVTGVVQVCCYLRSKKEIQVSSKTLRHYMALNNMIDVWRRTDIPESAIAPLNAYLTVGLPGFNARAAKEGKPQGQQTMDQHGFLSGQFAPVLGMLSDVYDYIFADVMPEVDVTDCVYKNRILVVLIPSLQKSEQEASALGKIVVSAAKMMMGANLGSTVEGEINDIINNRPTNSDEPYELIMDELGYYFAPGIDIMFAQARSLMLGLTASGQDFQAMSRGENKNAVESMIANTRLKIALATEDPKDTFEIFSKSAGEAYVARVSNFERKDGLLSPTGMVGGDNASIEKHSRISLEELRSLKPGDGIILYKQKVIRMSSYNIYKDFKVDESVQLRLNSMLPIRPVQIQEIQHKCKGRKEVPIAIRMAGIMMSGAPPQYVSSLNEKQNSIITNLVSSLNMALEEDPDMSPEMRGIVMFQSIVESIENRMSHSSIDNVGQENLSDAPFVSGSGQITDDPLSFLNETPIEMAKTQEQENDDEISFGKQNNIIQFSDKTKTAIEEVCKLSNVSENPQEVISDIENMVDNAVDYTMNAFAEQSGEQGEEVNILDADAILREFAELERLAEQASNA